MKINEYQEMAARTLKQENLLKDKLTECCLGLTGEAGELVDHIKKYVYHGHDIDFRYMKKELGDLLWYISAFATSCGMDLDSIAEGNIEKLLKRYPNGFSEEDSKNRVEYEEK